MFISVAADRDFLSAAVPPRAATSGSKLWGRAAKQRWRDARSPGWLRLPEGPDASWQRVCRRKDWPLGGANRGGAHSGILGERTGPVPVDVGIDAATPAECW